MSLFSRFQKILEKRFRTILIRPKWNLCGLVSRKRVACLEMLDGCILARGKWHHRIDFWPFTSLSHPSEINSITIIIEIWTMLIYCFKPNTSNLTLQKSTAWLCHLVLSGEIDGYFLGIIIFCIYNHTCTDIMNHSDTV